jgi:hypothetical protein
LLRITKTIISTRLAVFGGINFDVTHPLTSLADPYYVIQELSGFILWNKRVKSTRSVQQTTKLITHWQTTYTADLRGLERSRSIHSMRRKQPSCVLYIKFVLLATKTTPLGNIYYLVCCNHETLQNVRELFFIEASVYETEWRERIKEKRGKHAESFTRLSPFCIHASLRRNARQMLVLYRLHKYILLKGKIRLRNIKYLNYLKFDDVVIPSCEAV